MPASTPDFAMPLAGTQAAENAPAEADRMLSDPATPAWVAQALTAALQAEPMQAAADAQRLADVLRALAASKLPDSAGVLG